jgi:hypothetical protein
VGTRSLARIRGLRGRRTLVAALLLAALCGSAAAQPQPAGAPAGSGFGPTLEPTANPESAHGGAAPPVGPAATPPSASAPAVPSRPLAEAIQVNPEASCLDAETLVRRVARWLQRETLDARLTIEVHGGTRTPAEPSFTIDAGDGERAVRKLDDAPADCDQLHSALALSIALAIDATLAERAQKTPPPAATDDDELLQEKPEPPYLRFAISLFGQAASNLVSSTGVAPAASLRLELGLVRFLDLRVGALGSRVGGQEFGSTSGSFTVDLIAGRLEACPVLALRQLRVLGCVGTVLGSFRTIGRGFSGGGAGPVALGFYAFSASFELQAEILSWLGVAANVELIAPFQKRSIVLLAADGITPASEQEFESIGLLIGAGPVFRVF